MPLGANTAAIMGVAGVSTGDVVLLSSQTASGDSEIDFSSGITSTYGEYIFRFYNINPATDSANFLFQVNATDGADYNDSNITSAGFYAHHTEADASSLSYEADLDLAQSTSFQPLVLSMGNGADESYAGELHLFNPSSTTYVKHFISTGNVYATSDYTQNTFVAGYVNDTTAIDDIRFKMSTGDFDGKIKMWGVK